MGGIHPTALPQEALRHADAVVCGETPPELQREVLAWIVGALDGKSRPRQFTLGGPRPEILARPCPDFSWMRPRDYLLPQVLHTSVGCPYNCSFCTATRIYGGRMRPVAQELIERDVAALGRGLVAIIDDNFLAQRPYDHARKVCAILRRHRRQWVAELTARDLWQEAELIPLFAASGCYGVYIGIESVREKLPKGLHPHEYRDLVSRCHDNGLLVLGAFVFGVGEEEDEGIFEETGIWRIWGQTTNSLTNRSVACILGITMARLARVVAPGIPHHITQRGNRQMEVFLAEEDYRVYLGLLRKYARRDELAVYAYCLMTNHVHLVAVPSTEVSLARAFRDTHSAYASYVNRREGTWGHLWQGRFFSSVLDEPHLWAAVRYVERNPVRAGLVAKAVDYPWSSAAAHARGVADPLLSPGFPPTGAILDWESWLQTEEESASERLRRQTHVGRPCGAESFLSRLEEMLQRPVRPLPRGRKPRKVTADTHANS
jgi:putative transposase